MKMILKNLCELWAVA